MTKTLDRRPEIGLESFDRFFPNQDTIPKGGFGNLIALPLQKKAREKNHSVFLDEGFSPYADQWAFLSTVRRLERSFVETYVQDRLIHKEVLPVSQDAPEGIEEEEPWKAHSSRKWPVISEPLPKRIGVVLSHQIFVDHTGIPAILRNRILRLASFSNPEFYRAQAMRLSTWGKPRVLYCYEFFPKHIALPIGCLDELVDLLQHYGITLELRDERNAGSRIEVVFSGLLNSEQDAAAQALLKAENGVLSATTAFGKTVIALWLIAERKVNTLVLVHRKHLMDQWAERINQFLGVPLKEVGRIGGGVRKRTGGLDVAVLQSLCRKGEIEDWIKDYGQIIVDECHHVSAYSFERVVRSASARYKLGLSATLTRKDGRHPIVFMNLGPVRYAVNARKQAAARSFEHRVRVRATAFRTNLAGSASIQDLFHEISTDDVRNRMIVDDVAYAYNERRKILVLSERTEHLALLHDLLVSRIENLFVLKGGLGKKQVKEIMAKLDSLDGTQGLVILATGRYLGEGFDFPSLDTLFLTFPVSWKGTLAQYSGRLHREYYGKTEVIIHDYLDKSVPVLARMHAKRLTGYTALGYTVA
jgi:superfamily II DNA or RNA helicase